MAVSGRRCTRCLELLRECVCLDDEPEPTPTVPLGGFSAEPPPGPPYVHTFTPPGPIGELEDGTPVYPEPGPAYTIEGQP